MKTDHDLDKVKRDAMDMYGEAERHDGRYLLMRRIKGVGSPELNAKYDAAEWLVGNGYARWLTGDMAPGISLTGKPGV
jgi:hypothetical protein